MWLEDFCLAYQVGDVDDDLFIIQYLSLYLAESARAWLEHLPTNSIHSWADLKRIFIGKFQGMYVHLGNFWDLKAYKQKWEKLYVSTSVAFPSSAMSFLMSWMRM
jgi:hypothetical protein